MKKDRSSPRGEIVSRNPATGEILKRIESHSDQEIERRLQKAHGAFQIVRHVPVRERARCLERAAAILEAEKTELGRLMTLEMGKPIRASIQEAEKCAQGCRYYAENGERFLAQ